MDVFFCADRAPRLRAPGLSDRFGNTVPTLEALRALGHVLHLHSPGGSSGSANAEPSGPPQCRDTSLVVILTYDTHRDWSWWQGTLFQNASFLERLQKALSGIV